MINKKLGTVTFSDFILFPKMSLDKFLNEIKKDQIYSHNTTIYYEEFYLTPQRAGTDFFVLRLCFDKEYKNLRYILLSIQSNAEVPNWKNWNREKEIENKNRHDLWLVKELGVPPYQFKWGEIHSSFNEKEGSSYILINFV